MNEMSIELDEVKIKVEWPEDNLQPIVIAPLDSGGFFLISVNSLAGLSPGRLDEIRHAVQISGTESKTELWPDWARPSLRKERAIHELQAYGIPISDERQLGLAKYLTPDVTPENVQKALSNIEGSFSDFIIAEREKQ